MLFICFGLTCLVLVFHFLVAHCRSLLAAAARVTQLLVRCLRRLGPVEPVRTDLVRQLIVGDREALLLHLRRLTLGEHMPCLLSCPECGKKMDLNLEVGELLLPTYPSSTNLH